MNSCLQSSQREEEERRFVCPFGLVLSGMQLKYNLTVWGRFLKISGSSGRRQIKLKPFATSVLSAMRWTERWPFNMCLSIFLSTCQIFYATMQSREIACTVIFFSLLLFPFQELPQQITVFHFNLIFVSSTLTPTTCMSFFTASTNLLFGLPLCLLPGSSISSILLPMYPLSLLCTCPNHLNLAFLAFSPSLHVWVVPLMILFLILSILVTPKENLTFFSSATSSSAGCLLPSPLFHSLCS